MVGPLTTLLLLLWRYRAVQVVLATLYALAMAFGWLMERNVEGWHNTTPLEYVVSGSIALGALLVPGAVVLGLSSTMRPWLCGILLTWPLVLLSATFVASGCVISTLGCVPFELAPMIAGVLLPTIVVPATCGAAWLARVVRESLAIVFARDRAPATKHDRHTVPLFGGRPVSDDYFAGPIVRGDASFARRRRSKDGP